MSLGVIVLTKNQEKELEEVLKPLRFADEILVVDDYSEDQTATLAEKLGARVVKRKLDDFATQRNFALTQTKTDWVLFIDADEQVPPALATEIKEAISGPQPTSRPGQPREVVAYKIPRRNRIFGKVMEHTGWGDDERIVLFQREKGKFKGAVHEKPVINGRVGRLSNAIWHRNYENLDQFLTKAAKYAKLAARAKVASGYRFRWQDLVIEPVEEFLRRFFAWQGYRDGVHGLALSLLQAFVVLQVYLRVWQGEQFPAQEVSVGEVNQVVTEKSRSFNWWLKKIRGNGGFLGRIKGILRR